MPAQTYPNELSLLDARTLFFQRSGLGVDGGYSSGWVRIEAPFPLGFPNWQGRVDAARQHDLHHIATEYATDWPGEVEIAAWEIASGCRNYWAAWLLNLGGLNAGILVAPRRLLRAFVRGRRARTNLYQEPLAESQLAITTVGMLRDRIGLRGAPAIAEASDVAGVFWWSCISVLIFQGIPLLGLLLLWRLLR